MFEIFTTMVLAVAAIISPIKPDTNHIYIAQASSLNDAVLRVVEIPHPPEKSFLSDEKTEEVVRGDFDIQMQPIAVSVENSGDIEPNQDPTKQEIAKMIKKAFPDEPLMLKIAICESELEPKAKNKHSTAKGIFQILDGTWKHFKCKGDPFNAEDNISCGKKVLDGQGLSAWSESFSCWRRM